MKVVKFDFDISYLYPNLRLHALSIATFFFAILQPATIYSKRHKTIPVL